MITTQTTQMKSIILKTHANDCFALQDIGGSPWSQRHDHVYVNGSRRTPNQLGDRLWYAFRCRDHDCPGLVCVLMEDLLKEIKQK